MAMSYGIDLDSCDDVAIDARGWCMKKGHCKRLEARAGKKEHGIGRSAVKRSVNDRRRFHGYDGYAKVGFELRQARQAHWRELMLEDTAGWTEEEEEEALDADEQIEDVELEVEVVLPVMLKKEVELEMMSDCTSTTAGSTDDECLSVRCCSPWQRAMARAELAAKHWPGTCAVAAVSPRRKKHTRPTVTKEEMFVKELGRSYGMHISYDVTSRSSSAFEQMRWKFLEDSGKDFCSILKGVYTSTNAEVHLRPTPMVEEAQERFLNAKRELKTSVQTAFHGTNQANLESIYAKGLLVPGEASGVRVANGSAHGCGVYTTVPRTAATSFCYARGNRRPMLVCAALDDGNTSAVYHTCGYMIFFEDRRVIPLFEATMGQPLPAPGEGAGGAPLKKHTITILPPKPKRRGQGPRTRMRNPPVIDPVVAFLTRRPARRRFA
mmetsp:Transcript_98395/g.234260  ORF Transcript_98395/g.234260 Transcript_98395/m.234260 type:complete len:437 (+) Transcript_98395:74-1384(+)